MAPLRTEEDGDSGYRRAGSVEAMAVWEDCLCRTGLDFESCSWGGRAREAPADRGGGTAVRSQDWGEGICGPCPATLQQPYLPASPHRPDDQIGRLLLYSAGTHRDGTTRVPSFPRFDLLSLGVPIHKPDEPVLSPRCTLIGPNWKSSPTRQGVPSIERQSVTDPH